MVKQLFHLTISVLIFGVTWCHAADRANVSVVFPSEITAYRQAWTGFREYLEEQHVSLWVSEYNLKNEHADDIYSRIIKEKPDIIFTLGTKASSLARERIKDVPIVFCMVFNADQLITGNVTGASMAISDNIRLMEAKRILPQIERIGLIYSHQSIERYRAIAETCSALGLQLIGKEIASSKYLPDALQELSWQIDVFLMIPDAEIYIPKSVEFLLLESLKEKFPVIGLSSFYTKAGALFSFECDYRDLGRQAAELSLEIIDGGRPAEIQPTTPRKVNLSVNTNTAERLGIHIPASIIQNAHEVFGK